jgi:hypothetical protein
MNHSVVSTSVCSGGRRAAADGLEENLMHHPLTTELARARQADRRRAAEASRVVAQAAADGDSTRAEKTAAVPAPLERQVLALRPMRAWLVWSWHASGPRAQFARQLGHALASEPHEINGIAGAGHPQVAVVE